MEIFMDLFKYLLVSFVFLFLKDESFKFIYLIKLKYLYN